MKGSFSQFRARYILLDALIIFITYIVFAAIFIAVTGRSIKDIEKDQMFDIIFSIFIVVTIFWSILRRLKKSDIKIKFLMGNESIKNLPWLELLIIFYGIESLMRGISNITIYFVNLIYPDSTIQAIEKTQNLYAYNQDFSVSNIFCYAVLIIYVIIIAPIIEEFVFRGVLLHRFAAKWGINVSILLSTFLFGAIHANIYSIAIGISFIFISLLYIKTKNLIITMIFHSMHNAIFLITLFIDCILKKQVNVGIDDLWVGILYTAFSIPILLYFFKWPNRLDLLPYAANIESKHLK